MTILKFLGSLFLLFILIILFIALPLPEPFPPAYGKTRNLIAVVITGLLSVILIGLLVKNATASMFQSSHVLDDALLPIGMTANSYMLFGQEYRGKLAERKLVVNIIPAQGGKHGILNIYLSVNIKNKMAIGRHRPLLESGQYTQLDTTITKTHGLQVYAQEQPKAEQLLNDSAAYKAILRIFNDPEFREIYFRPQDIWVRVYFYDINAQCFQQWLDDIAILADAADKYLAD